MGLGMNPLQAGFFGIYGNEKIANNKSIDSYGYGFYSFVPLIKSRDGKGRAMTLSLEAQAVLSAGLNVQKGSSIAFIGTAPNKYAAKGYTLYGQLKFYPTQELGATAGYMRLSAINFDAYRAATTAATSFQKYNEISYVNLTYDLNSAVRLATELEHHVTQYGAKPTGLNSDRGQNNVLRVAAYYFF